MNDYSLRGHPRERWIYYIAAATYAVMPFIVAIEGWLGLTIAIGTFLVFSLIFYFVDQFVWRFAAVRKLFRIPDLNGRWDCKGQQIGDNGAVIQEWTAEVTIKQTWTRISIAMNSGISRSRSGPASIEFDAGHGYRLLYNYMNEPKPGQDLHTHRGTCDLLFQGSCDSADGIYFNDHSRKSSGLITLTKTNLEGQNDGN